MTAGATRIPWGRGVAAPRRDPAEALLAVWLGVLLVALACSAAASAAAEQRRNRLLDTEEGPRLVRLWHDMLDHSSDRIYSPTLFRELADDLEAAEADLAALSKRRVLDEPDAKCLARLFRLRYAYISEWHYTDQSTIRLSGEEATRKTALWIVELQLAVLRRPPTSKAEEELARAAVRNIAYELAFIHHLDQFEAESDRRRMALRERADAGENVDLEAFENEYLARRGLLLLAYGQRRLPRVRSVDEILPYLVALTRAEPSAHATARGSSHAGPL
jgi:hypothetical protein